MTEYVVSRYGTGALVSIKNEPDDGVSVTPLSLSNSLLPLGYIARLGLDTILIENLDSFEGLEESLRGLRISEEAIRGSKLAIVHTDYSQGLDNEKVASLLGVSQNDLFKLHQETLWQVELIGFAPGFPYLAPLGNKELWEKVGRLATPRSKVPKGSVAVAAGLSSIYPEAMPGGWHLIGITEFNLFDDTLDEPAFLKIGDTIRFEAI
jgi:KipI family sensor histidine kinase inhibitor